MRTLAEIKAYCDAATPGPWEIGRQGQKPIVKAYQDSSGSIEFFDILGHASNADFIANAREDLPELVQRYELLWASNRRIHVELMRLYWRLENGYASKPPEKHNPQTLEDDDA